LETAILITPHQGGKRRRNHALEKGASAKNLGG